MSPTSYQLLYPADWRLAEAALKGKHKDALHEIAMKHGKNSRVCVYGDGLAFVGL